MFNKDLFSQILTKIYELYGNQRDFAEATGINRTYLSKYINIKLGTPPTPKILRKIADGSKGITTYNKLMEVCGYRQIVEKTEIEQGAIEYLEEMVKRKEPGWSLVHITLNYIKRLEGK